MKTLLIVSLVLITATVTFAHTDSKDDVALKALVKQMTDAQIAFDASTLDKVFTSDYIEISPAGEFDPRAKVLGFYEKKPEVNADLTLDVSEFSIRSYGKVAIAIAKLTYYVPPPGPQRSPPQSLRAQSMRATFVCRKENGAWKIASSQYTGIRPTQPGK